MTQRSPHLLAILTASATLLAGIPLFAAALAPPPSTVACFSTAPFDAENGAESRGEGCGEERIEKEHEEDGDGKPLLHSGGCTPVHSFARTQGVFVADSPASARCFAGPVFSIRGPPAR